MVRRTHFQLICCRGPGRSPGGPPEGPPPGGGPVGGRGGGGGPSSAALTTSSGSRKRPSGGGGGMAGSIIVLRSSGGTGPLALALLGSARVTPSRGDGAVCPEAATGSGVTASSAWSPSWTSSADLLWRPSLFTGRARSRACRPRAARLRRAGRTEHVRLHEVIPATRAAHFNDVHLEFVEPRRQHH